MIAKKTAFQEDKQQGDVIAKGISPRTPLAGKFLEGSVFKDMDAFAEFATAAGRASNLGGSRKFSEHCLLVENKLIQPGKSCSAKIDAWPSFEVFTRTKLIVFSSQSAREKTFQKLAESTVQY